MRKKTYTLRKTFWTPYEQMKEHIEKKFDVLEPVIGPDVDPDNVGELFKIRLEDGVEIVAWLEEIFENSCTINGTLI